MTPLIALLVLIGLAAYPYLGYPLLVWTIARLRYREVDVVATPERPVSVVLTVFNEERRVTYRTYELVRLAIQAHPDSEVIVVSDGSTDDTASLARGVASNSVRVIELPENLGKANALNHGVACARHEIIVFADVRQVWTEATLGALLEPFRDAGIGAVSGDLELRQPGGELRAVGMYWKFEKWLRIQESHWYSAIGVTGAISAVRRGLFRPIPEGILLDDVCWPMMVVLQGKRVVHQPTSKAIDRLPPDLHGEYRRKIRTLSGNFQLIAKFPALLVPWRNPVWLQFTSHKLMRLASPWFLLAAWILTAVLIARPVFAILLAVLTASLIIGWCSSISVIAKQNRLLGAAAAIFMMNYAAWMAFWVWLRGDAAKSWIKVRYVDSVEALSPREQT